jgi:hypothetical protein
MTANLPDQNELQRLNHSLSVLLPRLDAITHEFCLIIEHADPSLRLKLPSNEKVIAVGIEELLNTVREPEQAITTMSRYNVMGREASIDETNLPVLLASIQTAMAETAGYTWTDSLEDLWSIWFDALVEWAVHAQPISETQAA